MKLSEVVAELVCATIANGRSVRTAQAYEEKLKPLVVYLEDKEVSDVTISDLRGYVGHLRGRTSRFVDHPFKARVSGGLSDATVASLIRHAKRLFNFAVEEGIIDTSPAKRLRNFRAPRGEPKAASMEDLGKLLDAMDDSSLRAASRDKALLLVLLDTGCRLGGLAGMKLDDINLKNGRIYLVEKGNKGRYAFIMPMTRDALRAWLDVRPSDQGDHLWSTLGSNGGDHLSTQGIRQVLRRWKKRADVTGRVNPHAWRHTFAREFLTDGGDLASLSDIMGHSDVKVTQAFYAIFRTHELQEKHDRHSPVARLARSSGRPDRII
ncbi:MAG: tyrosine-type recombinase/integrase [Chloroflexota bacterium]|nr:tyrosine-type recombinase/integrase [Chloroflexota bacterium]